MRTRLIRALLAATFVAGLLAAPAGTPAARAATPNYVALGDSYAAGPLILPPAPPWGCLKSMLNYANLLSLTAVGHLELRDVTCSGAQTRHMTEPQGVTPGPNPPQFDALDADTQLVTLQIGGNDIGFSGLTDNCFAPTGTGTPCQDAYVVNGVDTMTQRINDTLPKVAAVVNGIKARAPNAKVLVLGYPSVVPDADGIWPMLCWPQLPMSPSDVPWIRNMIKNLNAMVRTAATNNGATYVDVYTPSIGKDACSAPFLRWVEPLVITQPAAPIHPNLTGMLGMRNAIAARL